MPAPDGPVSTTHAPGAAAKLTRSRPRSRMPPRRWRVKDFETSWRIDACRDSRSCGKHRRNQELGIGLARIVEHLVGQAALDDAHRRMTMIRCDRRRATARSWVTMMAAISSSATRPRIRSSSRACTETSRPRCRLVHEDQPRMGDEVAGDLQALAHAAGKALRRLVDAVGFDLDPCRASRAPSPRILP